MRLQPGNEDNIPATVSKLRIDTREPWPHPWAAFWPLGTPLERGALETGDMALASLLEDGPIVERKTATDFLNCIGKDRTRFEQELKRSRYCGRFAVIVEDSLSGVIRTSRGLHPSAIIGTVAAWTRRYCPIIFCDTVELSAQLAFRFITQPVKEVAEEYKRIRVASTCPLTTLSRPEDDSGTSRKGKEMIENVG